MQNETYHVYLRSQDLFSEHCVEVELSIARLPRLSVLRMHLECERGFLQVIPSRREWWWRRVSEQSSPQRVFLYVFCVRGRRGHKGPSNTAASGVDSWTVRNPSTIVPPWQRQVRPACMIVLLPRLVGSNHRTLLLQTNIGLCAKSRQASTESGSQNYSN